MTTEKPKKVKVSKEDESAVEVTPTRHAYDAFYDDELKAYARVKIGYDLATDTCKIISRTVLSDSQPGALQKMQKLIVDKLLLKREK